MPARIDASQRRADVVAAASRLVARDGAAALSLRRVADEAELNVGSVRHYFDGSDDLLTATAEDVGRRMGERLATHRLDDLGAEWPERLAVFVEEVLPVDVERREEAAVLVEFVVASRTRPILAAATARMGRDLREALCTALASAGIGAAEQEADRLATLIGGLTMDAITPHGELGPAELRATLRRHLESLARHE
ncbi:TetR/AcrR family transcriptional regulator [Aeromicrobium piscarium]|uniref:TetR family transcriptional regulator n=1 Tax=Aeromicrobium piscarium TaxID=2590901 RepID=A0A554RWE9_9ACTN|nr:TetR family transcriptional regulator C-terminal domain-containing protein [Aeromicrobium piscarium]TSD58424.1 TetR family transcriptional regulator [Aeromicrobium piscarium]